MIKRRYLTQDEIKNSCLEIARQLFKDEWHPDYIVGITRGGLWSSVMLSHFLGINMFTLDVRLRDGNELSFESNTWMANDAYKGKKILIVDDINDTGETLQWIVDDWTKTVWESDAKWQEVWHKSVRFACTVDNLPSKFEIDYSGIEINKEEDPAWIVFPHEGWWEI